jgi:hypothetical protein
VLIASVLCVSSYKLGSSRMEAICLETVQNMHYKWAEDKIKMLNRENQERNFNPRYKHICMDDVNNLPNHTHATCIEWCVCEGTLCMALKRDYQIRLHMDTVWVYDVDSLVGMYITKWNTKLDSIIMKDNK